MNCKWGIGITHSEGMLSATMSGNWRCAGRLGEAGVVAVGDAVLDEEAAAAARFPFCFLFRLISFLSAEDDGGIKGWWFEGTR